MINTYVILLLYIKKNCVAYISYIILLFCVNRLCGEIPITLVTEKYGILKDDTDNKHPNRLSFHVKRHQSYYNRLYYVTLCYQLNLYKIKLIILKKNI